MNRLHQLFLVCGIACAFTIATWFFPKMAFADSPAVVVGKVVEAQPGELCVKLSWGARDVDSFTRDTLGREWFVSDEPNALKAGAVLIRSVAVWFSVHPEWTDPVAGHFCGVSEGVNPPITPFYFNLRSTKMQGFRPGQGATPNRGTCWQIATPCNNPNNRVTATMSEVALKNGALTEIQFVDTDQLQTNALALAGKNYKQILQDPSIYNSIKCGNQGAVCGVALTTASNYAFTPSMTNRTAPRYTQGNQPPFSDQLLPLCGGISCNGQHTNAVTAEGVSREGEQFWGFVNYDTANTDADHPPPPAPGIYVRGTGRGDKGEYRMNFGGHTNTIRISGIDDTPGPVLVNVYVDGIFYTQLGWYTSDDARRQINTSIFTTPAGTHTVAIELVEDYFDNSGCIVLGLPLSACDRNLYIDNFLITTP